MERGFEVTRPKDRETWAVRLYGVASGKGLWVVVEGK